MRLAELLPGWLLVIIKVRQVVKLISQIEKVFFQSVESLNELPALLVRKKRTNERQGVRNLVATWIVSCVCQLFVTVKFHMPTLELGLHICGKPVLAIRTHFGEEIFSETTGVLDRLGIGDLTLRITILRRFDGVVIASYTLSMGNNAASITKLISLNTMSRARSSSTSSSGQP